MSKAFTVQNLPRLKLLIKTIPLFQPCNDINVSLTFSVGSMVKRPSKNLGIPELDPAII